MGIFKKRKAPTVSASQDIKMKKAIKNAQDTFGYFYRELYWEYRRIISALNFAMVKIPFSQDIAGQEPIVEHMWIDNISFNGDIIEGELVNEPNDLTNIKKGDLVRKKVSEISDWMFVFFDDKTFGGFTIQLMRSTMSDKERKEHDEIWGFDFGDYNDILVVAYQKENPEYLVEHPMSIASREEMRKFLQNNPSEVLYADEDGLTLLHKEAIAGNRTMVEVLLEFKADKNAKSKTGKTPYDYAKQMNWKHLEELLK